MIKTKEGITRLFDVAGKVAVITGGGSGLGQAVGLAYSAAGAEVVLLDISEQALAGSVTLFSEADQGVTTIPCDVSDAASVETVFNDILDQFGHIDILVNSGGISLGKPAEQHTVEEFERIIAVNLTGTFLCCIAAGRNMIAQGGGKIINIGSLRGQVGSYVGHAAYGASKGGVHMLTRQLATEWAKYKINVNCIAPHLTRTPITEYIFKNRDLYESYMSRIPIGRPAETDDFVGVAIYLASAASDFVTGQILFVDGGSLAG
jgi:NAD(P)-dependent dehydrogenase (short-subunit alcohol dehydrogenase family)